MRTEQDARVRLAQAIFFLSFLEPSAQDSFVTKGKALLAARAPTVRERFGPAMAGLEQAVSGQALPREASHREVAGCRRLLGWTVDAPFLLGARAARA